MHKPEITLILPTFKRPKHLQKAIESVLKQTYEHFIVVVCDNGDDVETKSLVESYQSKDQRIQYFRHSKNLGLLKNFIFGLNQITTPYFTFLSDDDWLFPWFFDIAIYNMQKHPDIMLAVHSTLTIDHQGNIVEDALEKWPQKGYFKPPEAFMNMLRFSGPIWSGILFKKEVLEKGIGLDEEVGTAFDMDFVLSIARSYPVFVSTTACAAFYLQPSEKSSSTSFNTIWPGILKISRKIKEDNKLTEEMKNHAVNLFNGYLKKLTQSLFLRTLILNKEEEAKYYFEMLYNKDSKKNSFLLKALFFLLKQPFFRKGLHVLKKINNIKKRKKINKLHIKHKKIIGFGLNK